jgi:hypothetical protein
MSPYEILGIDRTASREQIEIAYREKAKKHHPDAGGSSRAFRQVQDAYDTLTQGAAETKGGSTPPNPPPRTESFSQRYDGSWQSDSHADGLWTTEPQPVWKHLLHKVGILLNRHGIHTAFRSKAMSFDATARCLILFVLSMVTLAVSVTWLWNSYRFMLVYETVRGKVSSGQMHSLNDGRAPGGSLFQQTHLEYSFIVGGQHYFGSDTLFGDDAKEFDGAGTDKTPVFYDRYDPSRNCVRPTAPKWIWCGAGPFRVPLPEVEQIDKTPVYAMGHGLAHGTSFVALVEQSLLR